MSVVKSEPLYFLYFFSREEPMPGRHSKDGKALRNAAAGVIRRPSESSDRRQIADRQPPGSRKRDSNSNARWRKVSNLGRGAKLHGVKEESSVPMFSTLETMNLLLWATLQCQATRREETDVAGG